MEEGGGTRGEKGIRKGRKIDEGGGGGGKVRN
jgi:hypothetical protein